jgi:hypothetical protein
MRRFKANKAVPLETALVFWAVSQAAAAHIAKPPLSDVSGKPAIHLAQTKRGMSTSGKQACNIVEACAKPNPGAEFKDICADDEFMKKLSKKCSQYKKDNVN